MHALYAMYALRAFIARSYIRYRIAMWTIHKMSALYANHAMHYMIGLHAMRNIVTQYAQDVPEIAQFSLYYAILAGYTLYAISELHTMRNLRILRFNRRELCVGYGDGKLFP